MTEPRIPLEHLAAIWDCAIESPASFPESSFRALRASIPALEAENVRLRLIEAGARDSEALIAELHASEDALKKRIAELEDDDPLSVGRIANGYDLEAQLLSAQAEAARLAEALKQTLERPGWFNNEEAVKILDSTTAIQWLEQVKREVLEQAWERVQTIEGIEHTWVHQLKAAILGIALPEGERNETIHT